MKIKIVAVFLIGIFVAIPAFAEDRCIECRQAALREWQKCMASAKTNTDMATCKEQGLKLQSSCDNGIGICKAPDPAFEPDAAQTQRRSTPR